MGVSKSVNDRLNEFALYHRDGDGECNALLLSEYAKQEKLTPNECFDLSYFFSIVYCCESGIILFQCRDDIRKNPVETAKKLKPKMIFQSDRKYMKMKNCFESSLLFWSKELQNETVSSFEKNNTLDIENALKEVMRWYMFGRFSAFLFLETYATLMGFKVTDMTIEWKNGDTATSGLLNLFGLDNEAEMFDKQGVLMRRNDVLDDFLSITKKIVEQYGGDTNTTKLETSLCAYRKFYKGTRYNGYYLDRMLEELNWYKNNATEYRSLTKQIFKIRKNLFSHDMLGELNGWTGVRKEMKKIYKEYGII